MTTVIAVSGKGGVGKTTLSALLIKYFKSQNKAILAVDADPNSTLDGKLGVKAETSIGALREEMMKNVDNMPSGMSKAEWLDYKMRLAVTEAEGFDLLSMGRPEGPGCYCYINQVLRTLLDKISEHYDYVIVDCEAGMEHLSRRTTRNIGVLLIVSDATKEGILTAGRIRGLSEEMKLKVGKMRLAVNLFRGPGLPETLKEFASEQGFDSQNMSTIPYDENIEKCGSEDCSVIDVPEDSKAYMAVKELAKIEFG
jgi:CO dehydrogenase maturation factor